MQLLSHALLGMGEPAAGARAADAQTQTCRARFGLCEVQGSTAFESIQVSANCFIRLLAVMFDRIETATCSRLTGDRHYAS